MSQNDNQALESGNPSPTLKKPLQPVGAKKGPGCLPVWPALLLGLLLPPLIWGLLYLYHRPLLSQPSLAAEALELQRGVLKSLEEEIDQYKKALEKDSCDLPPLAGPSPFNAQLPGAAPPEAAVGEKPADPGPAVNPPPLADKTPQNVGELLERATVLVVAPAAGQEGSTMGSGFFIAPHLIMTNNHVIAGSGGGRGEILVTNKVLGSILSARLVATVSEAPRDYAVLEITPPPGRNPSVLEFDPEVKRTNRVSAWGFPTLVTETDPKFQALLSGQASAAPEVVYTEGVVSVVQMQGPIPVISHTAEVSPGNSGGPLVNAQGRVVGINTFIRVDSKSNRQVNVALGSGDILSFLKEQGLGPPRP